MPRLFGLVTLIALFAGVNGCRTADGVTSDNIVEDEIKAMNELADAVEQKAPEEKIAELKKKLKGIDEKLEALERESSYGSTQLFTRHEDALRKAARRLTSAGVTNSDWKGLLKHFIMQLYPSGPPKEQSYFFYDTDPTKPIVILSDGAISVWADKFAGRVVQILEGRIISVEDNKATVIGLKKGNKKIWAYMAKGEEVKKDRTYSIQGTLVKQNEDVVELTGCKVVKDLGPATK
jgi:hypothetical protein